MGRGAARRRPGLDGGDRGRAAAVGILLLALVGGCSVGSGSGDGGATSQGGGSAARATRPAKPAAQIAVVPRDGATGVSPAQPVVVTAEDGRLTSVTVRNADGKAVRGALSADRLRWTSAEPLGYEKTYSVSAAASNADGEATRASSTFTTVVPRTFTMPYLFPGDGVSTVGVGQPITVRFDEPIADKAAAEKALSVRTKPAVAGSWHWFGDQNVHWRPKTYWKPGTKVTVKANVYGVHVGEDIYGQQDVASSFTIGPSRIATIDDNTHMMTVRISGKVVRTVPVAMGKDRAITINGQTIDYETQSGVHVVTDKHRVKKMSSASYGVTDKNHPEYYEENIAYAVRISPDGEFVHSAPWSVWAQGKQNVSHGCVNIAPHHAIWFYSTFSYGDIVDIRNTGRRLPQAPGYDEWGIPWSEWVAGSALR